MRNSEYTMNETWKKDALKATELNFVIWISQNYIRRQKQEFKAYTG